MGERERTGNFSQSNEFPIILDIIEFSLLNMLQSIYLSKQHCHSTSSEEFFFSPFYRGNKKHRECNLKLH